ncbi:hypothetical protein DJ73_19280 [Halorubrum sp. Ea1]|uniref:hypothetical protein n=1 Tax=Halorubrum sp. Ea1 TaxID=1480718 RepID=UPI000BDB748B|nr:hypothetical protein [Halorubrum sp. Ea1]OYR48488.1 hypothetical protein DJ73_19280 [Halorubrum sp. Ea1]
MRATDGPDASNTPGSSADDELPATLAGSRIVSAVRAATTCVGLWVRHSALYQWLTAEPDPEVIVIDLRETWTVGPFVRLLDWAVDQLFDAAGGSRAVGIAQRGVTATCAAPLRVGGLMMATLGLAVAGGGLVGGVSMTQLAVGVGLAIGGVVAMQDDRDWDTLRETRPVALTIAALEPPDPPDTAAGDDATAQSDARQQPNDETPPSADSDGPNSRVDDSSDGAE